MSLNTSKMILKIFGIISIIFGILGIIAGIMAVAGGALIGAGAAAGEVAGNSQLAALISVIMSIISIITMIMQKNQTTDSRNTISAIIGLLISILVFVAANTIKKAARK